MTHTLPELAAGDRVPNFVLPAPDGKFYSFYERVRGYRNILFLSARLDNKTTSAMLEFANSYETLQAHKIDVFGVVVGSVEELATCVDEGNLPYHVSADVMGKILEGFRELLGDSGDVPICLLLDANQRLLTQIERGDDSRSYAESALAYLDAHSATDDCMVIRSSAPVLLIPNVIEPELCRLLIDRWETKGHEEGVVESVVDGEMQQRVYFGKKRRLDHAIHDKSLTRELGIRVLRRLAPEIEKAFRFHGFRLDRFIIGCYQMDRDDYFRPHRDNLAPSNQDRMFALSINLNSEEYDGGDLRFPEYGPHLYRPETGGALAFSCSLIHEALPVTRGRRFVLLSFMRDARPSSESAPPSVAGA